MASNTYHEPIDLLSVQTREMHRALVSLMEELEAIDWYQQRADACRDSELGEVLIHNRDEEIEHASMLMEWVRRHNEQFDVMLRRYLFSELPIVAMEKSAEPVDGVASMPETLGIGSMKGR